MLLRGEYETSKKQKKSVFSLAPCPQFPKGQVSPTADFIRISATSLHSFSSSIPLHTFI